MGKFRNLIGKIPTGLLSGITVALILWLVLAPHPTGDLELPLFPGADKIVHAVIFGFLTLMVLLDTMKHRKWQMLTLPAVGIISILCALFGVGLEFVQEAMHMGRTMEVMDMLADAGGAILAGGVWAAVQEWIALPNDNGNPQQ